MALIKHGYLDDYERVRFALTVRLAEHHPLFGIKAFTLTEARADDPYYRTASIGRTFDQQAHGLIAWLRYVLYDGEEAELHVRTRLSAQGGRAFDPADFQPTSLKREEKLWNQLILIISDFFSDDQQSLADLQAFSEKPDITESLRCCAKIRLRERQSIELLHDAANKMLSILPLSFKEAKKVVNTDKGYA